MALRTLIEQNIVGKIKLSVITRFSSTHLNTAVRLYKHSREGNFLHIRHLATVATSNMCVLRLEGEMNKLVQRIDTITSS